MNQKRISQKDFATSFSLIILSTICLASSAGFGKLLTGLGSLQEVILIRFIFPLVILFVWFLFFTRKKFVVHSIKPHVLRAFTVLIGQYAFFYVLLQSNVLLATLFFSTNGLFSPVLTALFLKVRLPIKIIFSIVISFIGVVIAIGTWENIITPLSLIGLLSGLMTAAGQLAQHQIS